MTDELLKIAAYYHGSPQKLDRIKSQQAKGLGEFQNQKAVFTTETLDHAKLYALAKGLKGKTTFSVSPSHGIVVVGDHLLPEKGYVYRLQGRKVVRGKNEVALLGRGYKPRETIEVLRSEIEPRVRRVKDREALLALLKGKI